MATKNPVTELRVNQIIIKKLFRQYDLSIHLRAKERVTILHGRNGVGKTVTLAMVAALLQGRFLSLTKFPFERLRVDFIDHSFIEAQPRRHAVRIEYSSNKERSKSFTISQDIDVVEALEQRLLPFGGNDAIITRHITPIAWSARVRSLNRSPSEEPSELRDLRRRIPVHFIEAQRLFKITPPSRARPEHVLTSVVNEVAEQMAKTDSAYRTTSTQLDESLPSRLFTFNDKSPPMPTSEMQQRTESLERERERLRSIGLLANPTTSFDPNALNATMRAMFGVYLEVNEEKLRVFKGLADRAEILLGILNRKFAPKHIGLDKDQGYQIFSHDKQPLKLDSLSSGEQHELVLLHNLLFRVEPGALLLIDEPELSLHVTWQNEFLEDLLRIAAKVGFDALVATHSPYIVGGRRDLMEQLGDPV